MLARDAMLECPGMTGEKTLARSCTHSFGFFQTLLTRVADLQESPSGGEADDWL